MAPATVSSSAEEQAAEGPTDPPNDNKPNDHRHPTRKSSAPIPSPVPTSWATNADLAGVRANTPLAKEFPSSPNGDVPAPPPPPINKPNRTKSDASIKAGKTASAFKRMFGGNNSTNLPSAFTPGGEDVQRGLAKLSLTPGPGTPNGVGGLYTPASERGDPIASPLPTAEDFNIPTPTAKRANSTDGRFTLKSLLGSEPKLSRRASASSRKSDSSTGRDGVSAGGEGVIIHSGGSGYPESLRPGASSSKPKSRAPSSVGGGSETSLSKKYGVCERAAIGKGATSVVRLAHKWDRTEEKLYAVKEFRKRRKNESEREYVKKLTAEFCISSTLRHPNVVETVDLVQDEHQNWCEVMEYCPGGDLYAAIKKGGMSPSEVECSFKQILLGIQYLHSQGVAHRDIKPENLFFDAKGQLKIGDYGASTVYRLPWETTVHTSTGLCGSEPYIAPEQFNKAPYDARLVDIWACGIVYYCLHFQELPWRVAQMSEQLYAAYVHATQSKNPSTAECPETINNLSPRACRPLLRKMLEPKPEKRILIEDVMKDAWIQEIEVCIHVPKPTHIHVHARQMNSGGVVGIKG